MYWSSQTAGPTLVKCDLRAAGRNTSILLVHVSYRSASRTGKRVPAFVAGEPQRGRTLSHIIFATLALQVRLLLFV